MRAEQQNLGPADTADFTSMIISAVPSFRLAIQDIFGPGDRAVAWLRSGFAAIQFNAVVETNTAAVRLYESLGFVTLGTAPGAFRHPILGPTGLRIMWLDLQDPANATY